MATNGGRWRRFRGKHSPDNIKRRCSGCSTQLYMSVTLFALVIGTSAHEPLDYQPRQTTGRIIVAGSQLLALKSHFSEIDRAVGQLNGVERCSEDVNARVESEFLANDMVSLCRQRAADFDVKELLRSTAEVIAPSEQQTRTLCKVEACVEWLKLAAEAPWLPECNYRQSQISFRSLAETLLRIREDFVAFGEIHEVVAPNASMFWEIYELNQLFNLQRIKEEVNLNSPVEVSRQLITQEAISLKMNHDSRRSAAVEPPGAATGFNSLDSSADDVLSVTVNAGDTTGFTSSDVGPHASSTTTTTELTPSYAFVVGAWVLFNTSFFFLMRRK